MAIKLYNLEVLVDDLVYVGSDIRAKSQEDAVRILGINIVNPCAPLAKPFEAVPKTTATIRII